jgi:hypothetical protein
VAIKKKASVELASGPPEIGERDALVTVSVEIPGKDTEVFYVQVGNIKGSLVTPNQNGGYLASLMADGLTSKMGQTVKVFK